MDSKEHKQDIGPSADKLQMKHDLTDIFELSIQTYGHEDEIQAERLQEILAGYRDLSVAAYDLRINESTDDRTKIREQSSKEHVLYLAPPKTGCYAQPVLMYDDSPLDQDSHIPFEEYTGFAPVFKIIKAIEDNNYEEFCGLVKSPAVAQRAIEGAKRVLPKENEVIKISWNDEKRELKPESFSQFRIS